MHRWLQGAQRLQSAATGAFQRRRAGATPSLLSRSATSVAAADGSSERLFNGCFSTSYTYEAPHFKTGVGEFPIFRQMTPDGALVEGADLPFSLEEAVKMYETMVRSAVYDEILNAMQV